MKYRLVLEAETLRGLEENIRDEAQRVLVREGSGTRLITGDMVQEAIYKLDNNAPYRFVIAVIEELGLTVRR